MQLRLLVEADLSLKKAFKLIQGMEAAAKDVQEIQQDNKFTLQAAAATNAVTETTPKKTCSRCLGTGRSPATCRYKTAKCNKCHKVGHLARACHSSQPSRQDQGISKKQNMRQQNRGHVRLVTDHQTEPVADIVNIHSFKRITSQLQSCRGSK